MTTRTKPCDQIHVSQQQLYLMLVSSLRYAMGRQTYIVAETANYLRSYWKHLDKGMREVVLRDLNEELRKADELGYKLGADFDHKEWVVLRNELTERFEE